MSRASGITDEELAALAQYRESPLFSVLERQVLELAEVMTATPADVPDQLRAELEQQLGRAALVEIVSTVAWENHRARLNRALGVRAAGFSDGAYCVVPEHRP